MVPSLIDRGGYPTLRECVYLNQASLGLIADPAVEAMHDLLDRVVRHGNLHMSDEDEAGFLDGLRERAARMLSVQRRPEIAILSGASELLGQAPFLLSPPQGSKVIAVATDFPAITRPWLRLQERGECHVEFVEDRPDPTSRPISSPGSTHARPWLRSGGSNTRRGRRSMSPGYERPLQRPASGSSSTSPRARVR